MTREIIATSAAPAAIGPYSQAVSTGSLVFTAGQIGLNPATGKMTEGVENQARQVMANLAAILTAAGSSLDQVIKTTIFLQDMADFAAVNAIYGAAFSVTPPARSTVQVA
ncbi:MAG TPA: Rid family detoxifying hydrolase, partial [Anaerolineae bacterium]|nr:Rid family detoxifying hydrolase [Anaerolineae bacterium]